MERTIWIVCIASSAADLPSERDFYRWAWSVFGNEQSGQRVRAGVRRIRGWALRSAGRVTVRVGGVAGGVHGAVHDSRRALRPSQFLKE